MDRCYQYGLGLRQYNGKIYSIWAEVTTVCWKNTITMGWGYDFIMDQSVPATAMARIPRLSESSRKGDN